MEKWPPHGLHWTITLTSDADLGDDASSRTSFYPEQAIKLEGSRQRAPGDTGPRHARVDRPVPVEIGMQSGALEASCTCPVFPAQMTDAGSPAKERQLFAGLPVGDRRPGRLPATPVEEEHVGTCAAREEVRARATVKHVVAITAVRSVVATQKVDEVDVRGSDGDLAAITAEQLELQVGNGPAIGGSRSLGPGAVAEDRKTRFRGR